MTDSFVIWMLVITSIAALIALWLVLTGNRLDRRRWERDLPVMPSEAERDAQREAETLGNVRQYLDEEDLRWLAGQGWTPECGVQCDGLASVKCDRPAGHAGNWHHGKGYEWSAASREYDR